MIRREYCEGRVTDYNKMVAHDSCSYTLKMVGYDKIHYIGFTNDPEETLRVAKIGQFKGNLHLLYKINTKIDAKDLCHDLMCNFGFMRNNVHVTNFLESAQKKGKGPYYIYALIKNNKN